MKAEFTPILFFGVHCETQDEGSFDDIKNGLCPACIDCGEPTTIRIESDIAHTEQQHYYAQPLDYDQYSNAREIVFQCATDD